MHRCQNVGILIKYSYLLTMLLSVAAGPGIYLNNMKKWDGTPDGTHKHTRTDLIITHHASREKLSIALKWGDKSHK